MASEGTEAASKHGARGTRDRGLATNGRRKQDRGPSSSLALVPLDQTVCLRCGGPLRATVWDQPSLLRHGWLGEPLDYRVTLRICAYCLAIRRPDLRAVAVRRQPSSVTTTVRRP